MRSDRSARTASGSLKRVQPAARFNGLSMSAPQPSLRLSKRHQRMRDADRRAPLNRERATGMSQGASLALAAAFGLAALIFLAFAGHAYALEQRYAREGRPSAGTVLADSRQVGRSGSATTFETQYQFILPDGRVIRSEDVIAAKFFEGAEVTIEYLPGQAGQSRIKAAGSAYQKRMWLFLGLGAAFLLAGVYLAVYGLRHR